MHKILVFIPMYNCEEQIVRVLDQFEGEVNNYISEIIIVNNRSTDNGEMGVIHKLQHKKYPFPIKLLRNKNNYGVGGSHKVAFNYAIENKFDYVIVLHGDDQGSISDLLPILKNKSYHLYDCCLGGRFCRGSKLKGYSKFRIFGNHIFNFIFSVIMRMRILDLGSGLNMYSIDMLKSKFYIKFPDNFIFYCYMLFAVKSYKLKYIYFPITWREADQVSNVKIISIAWQTLKSALLFGIKKEKYLQQDARHIKYDNYISENIYGGCEYEK